MPSPDLSALSTPPACTADFCLIPLGTPTASVSREVAAVQRLLQRSGLHYSMHSAGTTLEGSWDDVMRVIGQAHALLHQNGVVRIQSDIRVGSRTDKKQSFEDKVAAVEKLLQADHAAQETAE
ncbi:cell wall biogenesis protein [Diplodia corticola]|uniref:Cell wall biogenesis protein n=1 Tax=Diplodia corticola TaxID=236234 RepID=A0A1J9RV24_9PEZI|nr:cell wall biogenesis protein [Diplodia corticola]OJD31349.1 cell wall biogenesis protein [Diplodia corticola]